MEVQEKHDFVPGTASPRLHGGSGGCRVPPWPRIIERRDAGERRPRHLMEDGETEQQQKQRRPEHALGTPGTHRALRCPPSPCESSDFAWVNCVALGRDSGRGRAWSCFRHSAGARAKSMGDGGSGSRASTPHYRGERITPKQSMLSSERDPFELLVCMYVHLR